MLKSPVKILLLGTVLLLTAASVLPAGDPSSREEAAQRLIDQLNSTSQPGEMVSAKSKLIAKGTTNLPYLHTAVTNDKRIFVRVQCCFILGKIADPSSIPVLERAAQSPYPALNRAAVIVIRNIGGKEAVKSLERLHTAVSETNFKTLIRSSLKELETRNRQVK